MPQIKITNPEKVIFPKAKIAKKELVEYYKSVSSKILPYIKDRPLALVRYPNGIDKEGFYQKNAADYFPKWIKTKKIKKTKYIICNDKDTLTYLANQAVIEFHHWLSKINNIDNPDIIAWDIDPPSASKLSETIQASLAIKKILEHLRLPSYIMSTGSKGFHVIVPTKKELNFTEARKFAVRLAEIIVRLNPKKFTLESRIEKRRNRVYIDCLRNSRAQLKIAPYSLRAKEPATVAMPLSWQELNKNFKHNIYTIKTISKYLQKDPWKDFFKNPRTIKPAMKGLDEIEESA